MVDEYISKQDAINALEEKEHEPWYLHKDLEWISGVVEAKDEIKAIEPADVVQVVRCDDCEYYGSRRWCELHSSVFDDNAFCSYGERREE